MEIDQNDVSTSQGMPRIASNYQKLGGSLGKILFHAFRESVALPILWLQTSGLQNYEAVHFCCLKTPRLWYLLERPKETTTVGKAGEQSLRLQRQMDCREEGTWLTVTFQLCCLVSWVQLAGWPNHWRPSGTYTQKPGPLAAKWGDSSVQSRPRLELP